MGEELTVEPAKLELMSKEEGWAFLDRLASAMGEQLSEVSCPIEETLTPGLYRRKCLLPAGTLIISHEHVEQHPYVIHTGKLLEWIPGNKPRLLEAPTDGITEPGTRRLLYVLEHTVWTTFHSTLKTSYEEIYKEIWIRRISPFVLKEALQ